MNLHFRRSKIFGCDGRRATILSVSQLLSVKLLQINIFFNLLCNLKTARQIFAGFSAVARQHGAKALIVYACYRKSSIKLLIFLSSRACYI